MALAVNGQPLEWAGYQYGIKYRRKAISFPLGTDLEEVRREAADPPKGRVVFRTVYVDGWEPCD